MAKGSTFRVLYALNSCSNDFTNWVNNDPYHTSRNQNTQSHFCRGKRNCCILGVSGESETSYFSPSSSLPDFVKEQKLERSSHFISTLQHKVHGGLRVRKGTWRKAHTQSVVQSEIIQTHLLIITTLASLQPFPQTHANFSTHLEGG